MTKILLIDDSEFDRELATRFLETEPGWEVVACESGEEALCVLRTQTVDLVITDLRMPGIDGLDVIREIHAEYPLLPVILMTSHGSEDVALQALDQGAASYIPKGALQDRLLTSVDTVLSASRHQRKCSATAGYIVAQSTTLKLPSDRKLVPDVVTWLQDAVEKHGVMRPEDAVRVGVALEEALLNAIIHGNLEISSELRGLGDGTMFDEMIDVQSAREPYCRREVTVNLTLHSDHAVFDIADEGPGFDVSRIPDPTDPENLLRPSGRGLLLMQAFMDGVEFDPTGNRVRMTLKQKNPAASACGVAASGQFVSV